MAKKTPEASWRPAREAAHRALDVCGGLALFAVLALLGPAIGAGHGLLGLGGGLELDAAAFLGEGKTHGQAGERDESEEKQREAGTAP